MSEVLTFCERQLWWPLCRWWECRIRRCDYYQSYQALGAPELTHVGYHAAGRMALEHRTSCTTREEGKCETCETWAERLRGEVWEALMGNRSIIDSRLVEKKKKIYGFITK
jgi:hypothetical protein